MSDYVIKMLGKSDPSRPPSNWLSKLVSWRWWLIGICGVLLFLLEFREHYSLDALAIYESLLFISLLVFIGFLVEMLLSALNARARDARILEWRHNLSLQLGMATDSHELAYRILENLASITHLEYASLLAYDADDASFDRAAEWKAGEEVKPDFDLLQPAEACHECVLKEPQKFHGLTACEFRPTPALPKAANVYCLPLVYGNTLVAVIRFVLPEGHKLSKEECDILNNIGFEMAIALVMAQQREVLADIQASEATLAERRNFSRDLHDTLGQNLAYLRLKLEEFSSSDSIDQVRGVKGEMKNLLDVADESLGLVRGMLSVLGTETQVNIERLMREHGAIVGERAGFSVSVNRQGEPRYLLPQIQRQVIFLYREALSNIERHAEASKVEVTLQWGENDLCVQIQDNGRGFDPQQADTNHHFGLAIMRERAEMLQGKFEVCSSSQAGTLIQFWVPV